MLVSTLVRVATALQLLYVASAYKLDSMKFMPRDLNTPSQQRLAYLGDDGMTVSWNTFQQLSNPTVKYGLDPNNLSETADSNESVTYPTSTTWNNHVQITGLKPDTTYYYQVQFDTKVYQFTTAKAAGTSDEYTFAVVIDFGTMGHLGLSSTSGDGDALSPSEQTTVDSLTQSLSEFDFVLHPGDIAYADYWLKEENQAYLPNTTISGGIQIYENILNAFYDEVQPITSVKPYMVAVGNHEADCIDGSYKSWTDLICSPGQTNFTGFVNHWRMPSQVSGGVGNFWYSFDYGLVHFVTYSSETDFPNGIEVPSPNAPDSAQFGPYANSQLDWIVNDLKNVDRTKTPWVIVAGHRPWYVAGTPCTNCQEAFEETFNQYNVDLIISGHVHNYERLDPIATGGAIDPNGLNNPSAPWYILNGIAGHYDGIDKLSKPLPDYVAFAQDKSYGWSRFTVHNSTHLTHEFVQASDNSVLDTATLYKKRAEDTNSTSSSAVSSAVSSTTTSSASGSASLSTSSGSGSSSAVETTDSLSQETVTDESTTVITITSCSDNKCSEVTTTSTLAPASAESDATETVTDNSTTVVTITSCSDNKCSEVVTTSTYSETTQSPAESTLETTAEQTSESPTDTTDSVAPEETVTSLSPTTGAPSETAESTSSEAGTSVSPEVTTSNAGNKLSVKGFVVAALALVAL